MGGEAHLVVLLGGAAEVTAAGGSKAKQGRSLSSASVAPS